MIVLVLLQMARHVVCPQFCHTTGSTGGIICGLYYGNTVIIPAPTFDAQKTLNAIQQERWLICYYDLSLCTQSHSPLSHYSDWTNMESLFDSWKEKGINFFSKASRLVLEPSQLHVCRVPKDISLGLKRTGHQAAHSPTLVTTSWWVELYSDFPHAFCTMHSAISV
jgi:hypothetical protein